MHENFLSYIMIGLSRGLAPWGNPAGSRSGTLRRPTEEEIVLERGRRERAARNEAIRDQAEAEKPGPQVTASRAVPAVAGSWHRSGKSSIPAAAKSRLPSFAQPVM